MNRNLVTKLYGHGCTHQYHGQISDVVLTPEEVAADAIASLENRSRYLAQSRETEAGRRGRLPRRNPLKLFVFPENDNDREPVLPDGWTAPNTPDDF